MRRVISLILVSIMIFTSLGLGQEAYADAGGSEGTEFDGNAYAEEGQQQFYTEDGAVLEISFGYKLNPFTFINNSTIEQELVKLFNSTKGAKDVKFLLESPITNYEALTKEGIAIVNKDRLSRNNAQYTVYVATTQKALDRWLNGDYVEYVNGKLQKKYTKSKKKIVARLGSQGVFEAITSVEEDEGYPKRATYKQALDVAVSDKEFIKYIKKAVAGKNLRLDAIGEDLGKLFTSDYTDNERKEVIKSFINVACESLTSMTKEQREGSSGGNWDYDAVHSLSNHINKELIGSYLNNDIDYNKAYISINTLVGYYTVGKKESTSKFIRINDYLKIVKDIEPQLNNSNYNIYKEKDSWSKTHACWGEATQDINGNPVKPCNNPICKIFGHLRFSGQPYIGEYLDTLRPYSKYVANTNNKAINPFGGWAYISVMKDKKKRAASPSIYVELVADINGKTVIVPDTVAGWTRDDLEDHALIDMRDSSSKTITQDKLTFNYKGKEYRIETTDKAKIELKDEQDGEMLNDTSETIKISDKGYEMKLGRHTPDPNLMGLYLTNADLKENSKYSKSNNPFKSRLSGKSKFFGKPNLGDGEAFTQVKLQVYVKATETGPTKGEVNEGNELVEDTKNKSSVPEWRISKYWGKVVPDDKAKQATMTLSFSSGGSCREVTPYLEGAGQLGYYGFSTRKDDYFRTKGYILGSKVGHISMSDRSDTKVVNGDLLAVKTQAIDTLRTPAWIPQFNILGDFDIPSGYKGVKNSNKYPIMKSELFQYGIDTNKSFTLHKAHHSHTPNYNKLGVLTNYDYNCKLFEAVLDKVYGYATYDIDIDFDKHKTKVRTGKKIEDREEKEDGSMRTIAQSPYLLSVYPEVPMYLDGGKGNVAVLFVVGEERRDIKPISVHTIDYDNIRLETEVIATESATHPNVVSLLKKLNAGTAPVLYKGGSFEMVVKSQGKVEARSYILDVGNKDLSSKWENTGYRAEVIHNNFLNKVLKVDKGVTKIKYDFNRGVKINGKLTGYSKYEREKEVETESKVINHTLVVRGGKLLAVDGDYKYSVNLRSKNPKLYKALEDMNLINGEALQVFARGEGDKLTETNVAKMGNLVRSTTDMEVGKGWYFEDTTALVVREYIEEITLPHEYLAAGIPSTIKGIESETDRNLFFTKGYTGHVVLNFSIKIAEGTFSPYKATKGTNEVEMTYDSSERNNKFGDYSIDYVVLNVSVFETSN